jgi:NTE family protein
MKGSEGMLGLALEGGGAKGAFHMGAVKAFLDKGYSFDGVAGTSIGALNGALIAQGDFELGYSWWQRMDTSLLFDVEQAQMQKLINKKIDKAALSYLSTKIRDIIENRGLDTKKIRETLESVIDEEKLRASSVDFGMVTVSLSDLKPLVLYKEDIPKGKMVSYLMASANLPVFKNEPLDGKRYIDGAFYDNLPINLLIRKGYREVVAVRTLGLGVIRKVEDTGVKVINVTPSEDLGSTLNFDNNLIQTNLKMGYYDAMRAIKGFKGRKYYIEPAVDDNLFFYGLLSVPEKAINEMAELMRLPQMEPRRMLFEKIIPGLSQRLGLPAAASHQDIIIAILENVAEKRGIERFKIQSFSDLLKEIKSVSVEEKKVPSSFISNLARGRKLSTIASKDIILKKAGEELLNVLKVEKFN